MEGLRNHFRRLLEQERSSAAKDLSGASSHHSDTDSLVVRRDFVALVKLFRDLLFETTRLRSLVNRVQLDPSLAHNLRALDVVSAEGGEKLKAAAPTGGLLAPLSRLFGSSLLGVADPAESVAPRAATNSRATPTIRPIGKLSGSSGVSSATVSVEFNSGVAGRVVAVGGAGVASPKLSSPRDGAAAAGANKSGTQVRRDLNSIFAGGLSSTATRSPTDPWVVVPPPPPPTRQFSSNPFGRLLASYRPALSSTTNAVLDSIPHAPQSTNYEPPLLERTLRARGLSDSSIRSTFVAHANPHHRIITPATLALSSERSNQGAVAITIRNDEDGNAVRKGLEDLSLGKSLGVSAGSGGKSVSRKSSLAVLRRKPSGANLKPPPQLDSDIPPVPSLPISISPSTPAILIAPSRSITPVPSSNPATLQQASHLEVQAATTLFGSLSSWVTAPLAVAVATESTSPGAGHGFKSSKEV